LIRSLNSQKAYSKTWVQGYLTVFITLTLTVVLALCLTLIEGVRRNTIRLEAECAVDAGMNSVLAEFHRELFAQYDLLFVDTSYGTSTPSYERTASRLEKFVKRNLGEDEILLSAISGDLLEMHLEETKVLGVSVASDQCGASLRRQIAEYMYEKTGVVYFEKLLEWVNIIEKNSLRESSWLSRSEEAEKQLNIWVEEAQKKYPDKKISVDGWFQKVLWALRGGILNLTVDMEELSHQSITAENYLSHRKLLTGTTGLREAISGQASWEQFLVQEYILEKTGRYGQEKEGSLLKYQTEYILAGLESDIDNLKAVADALFVVREGANVLHIMGCDDKMSVIQEISDGLAAAIMMPEASPVIQILVIAAWAGIESVYDVKMLLAGEEVPLIKTQEQWIFGWDAAVANKTDRQAHQIGLCYADYLRIFMMLQDVETMTDRMMDIIEMDIRQTPGNEWFRLDGCIDCLKVQFEITGKNGYTYEITRKYGY